MAEKRSTWPPNGIEHPLPIGQSNSVVPVPGQVRIDRTQPSGAVILGPLRLTQGGMISIGQPLHTFSPRNPFSSTALDSTTGSATARAQAGRLWSSSAVGGPLPMGELVLLAQHAWREFGIREASSKAEGEVGLSSLFPREQARKGPGERGKDTPPC